MGFLREKNMKKINLLLLIGINFGCATRFEANQCPAPSEYRKKTVVSIMKEAKEIVSSPGEKRAVVFCIYGSKNRYTKGFLENIKMVHEMYPGWDVVVFLDPETVPKEIIDEAKARGAIVKADVKYHNAASRFFIADMNYDRFISRDADSRIYPREVAAVADWMKNDWAFIHNMRDSKIQVNPVLAGMWGAQIKPLRERLAANNNGVSNVEELYFKYMNGRKAEYGDDELFLKDIVLKAIGEDHFLSHESFRCDEFKNSRGFPIPRGSAGVHIGGIRNWDDDD